jgi:hypothetical protein
MSESERSSGEKTTGEKTTGGDRRRKERRRDDRRGPVPPWRRPWAFVLYGVGLAITVVLVAALMRGGGDPPPRDRTPDPRAGVQQPQAPPPPDPAGAAEEATGHADYERLLAEGGAARGRLVRVELYCGSVSSVATRQVPDEERALADLADAEGRVPAAECKWGRRRDEVQREDLMLVVPPHFVERFAQAPTVEDGFVRRRRVVADIEWMGRSEGMALRTTGILRRYPAAGG